ncbi:MAG: MurR/RpiR family transcriptional regulator [Alphaproteobacteria bacterium]|nr:MurR/RpiR family transcriptional regulator [Alphaproteobacteria bacterium]
MQVRARIEQASPDLTNAERKLCTALLSDYPFAGLEPIQVLAERTKVSSPSISRFVNKLGFQGYGEFQRQLINEMKQGQRSPVHVHGSGRPIHDDYLENFMARATELMSATTGAITQAQFDRVCTILMDKKRSVYVLGGRFSDSIALHFSRHLRLSRPHVHHLPADPEIWPEYMLRMKPRDILFLVDFRRYQPNLLHLAKYASDQRSARIVLVTDKWLSPVSRYAAEILAAPIEIGTVWDSYTPALALIEAVLTRIAEETWHDTRARIEAWDAARMPAEGL